MPLNALQIKEYMKQILTGVHFCHASRIIHRDLKPSNILLSGKQHEQIKLADFGLARAFSIPIKPYTKNVVTLFYRSPELLFEANEYATPVDMWSVGCIFAELARGKPLFEGQNEIQQCKEIFRIMGTPSEEQLTSLCQHKEDFQKIKWTMQQPLPLRDYISLNQIDDHGLSLLYKMLEYDPKKRITAKQALQDPYF